MTAHDFPSVLIADEGGIDMILVGDSLAMVALGMKDILHYCRAVSRGVRSVVTAPTISRITFVSIPVLSHIGLTLRGSHSLGGFRVQGKPATILAAVLAPVSELITEKLKIPTKGISTSNGGSGQVPAKIDTLGNFPKGRFMPKFVKQYGDVFKESKKAVKQYREDISSRAYPAKEHTLFPPKNSKSLRKF
ncbi:Pyruvate/Phosphoenolpyruvate kinase-like domain-containing protein [Tuber borchii]|uniref:3-methyl-2-oxobutanoate hydroxymethyltransferase n=1 Tax=Tuber borchii TaxID=42251 RepID=A0A2T7A037_TUBBO|nr:Pyruvate/Phosphoenolpyruvate kinase-like domain-containing protein [Tuber borchii]